MATVKPVNAASLSEAVSILKEGDLVAFPTETVYGLGANACDDAAVAKIFAAKQRPDFNPLISHFAAAEDALAVGRADARAKLLAHHFWPGPLTMILRRADDCPIADLTCAGLDTVAVRVPAHPVARDLIAAAECPLAAPSANLSGTISPTAPVHVAQSLGDNVSLILAGGACEVGLESTVVDLSAGEDSLPVLLRPGAITADQMSDVLGCVVESDFGVKTKEDKPRSPGQALRHYAPNIPIRLRAVDVEEGEALLGFGSEKFMGVRGGGRVADMPETAHKNLSAEGDLNEAAANLFAMLRALDRPENKKIAVMDIPEVGLGIAINERLRRAAQG